MQIESSWLRKFGGLAVATMCRAWMSGLDYRAMYYDRRLDPVHPRFAGPAIFLFWHEYIPYLFYLRGHCKIAMLLSRHHDAEWIAQAARFMGFDSVRGSTDRGGIRVLREIMRERADWNLAMTPDGPRGPRRHLAKGCIYLSSRLGIPLAPIGLGYQRPWRWRSAWDQFAVPRPGCAARAVAGPLVQIPRDADRDALEVYRQGVENLLNGLTEQAEAWADSGERRPGQMPVWRQAAGRGLHLLDEGPHESLRGADGPSLTAPGSILRPAGAHEEEELDRVLDSEAA